MGGGGGSVTGAGVIGDSESVVVGDAAGSAGTGDPVADGTGRFGEASSEPGGLRRVLTGVRWYWSSIMGDNHYERYLAHHARTHPGETPLTKREYWRMRTDAQDRNPGARCC